MKLIKLMGLGLILTLASCQSANGITDPNNLDYASTQGKVYQPVLLTREEAEVLSAETLKSIVDHNNIYFCKNPDQRPDSFDESVCKTKE